MTIVCSRCDGNHMRSECPTLGYTHIEREAPVAWRWINTAFPEQGWTYTETEVKEHPTLLIKVEALYRHSGTEQRSTLPFHEETIAGLNSLTVRSACEHIWKDIDSQFDNTVKCTKCSMAGERQRDGTVYWPAT